MYQLCWRKKGWRKKAQHASISTVFFALFAVSGSAFSEGQATLTDRHQGIAHDALFDVCFDGEKGLAVGVAGTVLESVDGGKTWIPKPMAVPAGLLGITCEGQKPIVVGQSGVIFVQQGESWKPVKSGTDLRLLSVSANQQGLAVAVGGFGALLKSTDSGETWSPITVDWEALLNDFIEPHVYDVDVSGSGVITLVAEFELVLRSVDGGETWETLNKGDASLNALHLRDEATGFAVGQDGKVLRTQDGGVSWESLEVDTDENLLDVWSGDDGTVVVSGIRTLLKSKDDGETWLSIEEGDVPIKWYQALGASEGPERNVVMVGHSGRVVQIH